jgi:hypothetical protein
MFFGLNSTPVLRKVMKESAMTDNDYFLLRSFPQPLARSASSAYQGVR